MATCIWWGRAEETAQVDKFTPATVTVGNTFTLTCNAKTVTFTATAATVANVTAGLTAAWNASEEPEMQELTAADVTTYLTLTCDTPGLPFTVTSSAATGTGTPTPTLVRATVTANSSPHSWGIAANWSGGAVPVDSDDVILADSGVDILYDLEQTGEVLASLKRLESFTGKVGLPQTNEAGYREYRDTSLKIDAAVAYIEQGSGDEAEQIKWNPGASPVALTVVGRDASASIGSEPLRLTGGWHATNTLTAVNAGVAVAVGAGETATFATLTCTNSTMRLGVGVTWTTFSQNGGESQVNSGGTTYRLTGESPVSTIRQAAAITTLDAQNGTVYDHGTGTVGTVTIGTGATVDRRNTNVARTYTAVKMAAGSALYGGRTLVHTTLDLQQCGLDAVTLDLGENIQFGPRTNL